MKAAKKTLTEAEVALVAAAAQVGKKGRFEAALDWSLKQQNCEPQIYFGGTTFIGRHCATILGNVDRFFADVIFAAVLDEPQAEAFRDKFKRLMELLGVINHTIRRCTTDLMEEIDEMEEAICEFSALYRKTFPEKACVTPKRHLLEAHIVEFARRWGTVGLFSEEAVESIHALINRVLLRYTAIRDREKKMRCVQEAIDAKQSAEARSMSKRHGESRKRTFKDVDHHDIAVQDRRSKAADLKEEAAVQARVDYRVAASAAPAGSEGPGVEPMGD